MRNFIVRNRLRELAKEKGVTPDLIAILLNVHYTTVSQWVNNHYQPNNHNISKLLDLLEVNYNDLIIVESRTNDRGIGRAIQKRLYELKKVEKKPLYTTTISKITNKPVKKYNPKIVKELKELEKKYQQEGNDEIDG
ncbi:Helix-turn-helix [Myroides marinus]|uniref:Helix-turn-helix n=1 Tax=Myroides marinus TaxID=703342 RepID=A0A1H6Y7A0_9FLAO|nr:helix-turn-helix transcriptional regulator [Myroides marinus]SEJ32990.1 Helix-turn-helix [Myroides marinus]